MKEPLQNVFWLFRRITLKPGYSRCSCLIVLAVLSIIGIVPLTKTYVPWFHKTKQLHEKTWSDERVSRTLEEERRRIRATLKHFTFLDESPIRSLKQLLPEEGGSQLKTIIISSWRSGSTFLGDILNSHPATVYHYEPLKMYRAMQIRAPPHSEDAFNLLAKLLNSNYSETESYLKFEESRNSYVKRQNIPLNRICKKQRTSCFDPTFLSQFLKLYPFMVLKIVRLRLSIVERFLEHPRYNTRVILLVRDPRGSMISRRRLSWCRANPDCNDPLHTCADLVSDYATAIRFSKKFPKKFLILRYEDLALNPINKTEELFRFIGLKLHQSVEKFLLTHTKFNAGNDYTTYRNSSANAFAWREKLPKDILPIQTNCETALKLWGYRSITNFANRRNFFPLEDNFSIMKRQQLRPG